MIRFKHLLGSLLLGLYPGAPTFAEGIEVRAPILIRDPQFRPRIAEETLTDLHTPNEFNGRHFRILKGKSEWPIPLAPIPTHSAEPPDPLALRAATVYHHLGLARRFWVEVLRSEFVRDLPALSVRLEITNLFSDLAHFQNDSIDPQFNNALSIPAGTPFPGSRVLPWGPEIWFRPLKRIPPSELRKNLPPRSGASSPLAVTAEALRDPLRMTQVSRILQTSLEATFFPAPGMDYSSSLIRSAGTWVFAELILSGLSRLNPGLFLDEYYLDAGMVPEIIYHEFSHIALSPYLKLNLSTPVLEGMADYFAARISNHPVIAGGIEAYSKARPKDATRRSPYQSAWEESANANSDFVLSLLWMLHQEFPDRADAIILGAAQRLSGTRGDIRHDLIRALLEGCRVFCGSPARDGLRMRTLFEERRL
jgi:hypothetical protein